MHYKGLHTDCGYANKIKVVGEENGIGNTTLRVQISTELLLRVPFCIIEFGKGMKPSLLSIRSGLNSRSDWAL